MILVPTQRKMCRQEVRTGQVCFLPCLFSRLRRRREIERRISMELLTLTIEGTEEGRRRKEPPRSMQSQAMPCHTFLKSVQRSIIDVL